MIIYPPHIGDTVPGFTSNGTITVPYTDNQAVDKSEISKMSCIVRSLSNSTILATAQSKEEGNINEFEFSDISFTESNYYKFQIAYVDKEDQVGPYSSVAIGRCVGEKPPTIGLKREEDGITFVGTYEYKLVTEPIYEYCFDFKNVDTNELIHTTGWKISDTTGQKNSENLYQVEFSEVLYQELKYSTIYEVTFSIRTINNYTQSVSQTFMKQGELPILADIKVLAIQDKEAYENGYVKVALKGQAVTGYFELLRRAKDSNVWDKIADIDLLSESNLENFIWKDWSVEHGATYTYAIRRRGNVASTKNESSPITVYFEDMFLSDGEKQLKIRFNPKVSSFKNTILEQKIDTIGGQYPFFFRNGSVKYKEIPISGLVSYYMDEANLFMSNEELGVYNFIDSKEIATASIYHGASAAALKTTDLVDYNIAAEKRFKLAVLDWLTNGEPKLFRSPTEGNYVVKLMNTSLSPNETLGRMLHSFSSTGYECGPHDYKSLKEQGIMLPEAVIKDPKPLPTVKTIMLYQAEETIIEGDFWNIVYETSSPTQGTQIKVDGKDIVNITGRIVIPSAKKIEWEKQGNEYSTITYMYQPELIYNEKDDIFKTIANGSTDVMSTLESSKEEIKLSDDYHWIYSLILTPKQEWGYKKVVNYQKISEMTDWSKVEAYKKTVSGEYELLTDTDEPDDWGEKEASYYTKVEDQVWTLLNAGDELTVTIDGISIDLSDGNPRYYNDCTIDKIKLGADVSGVIYGRKIKEPVREETK